MTNFDTHFTRRRYGFETSPHDAYELIHADVAHALSLTLRFRDGGQCSFPYLRLGLMHLQDNQRLTLETGDRTYGEVVIAGQNLLPLFESLSQHRVKWIREADNPHVMRRQNVPFVASITLTPAP